MGRYLQKISLKPFSDTELWTGWELEGRTGDVDGLICVDGVSDAELAAKYGVTEFQKIPGQYLSADEFRPKQR